LDPPDQFDTNAAPMVRCRPALSLTNVKAQDCRGMNEQARNIHADF